MTAPRDARATALVALLAAWWVTMTAGNLPWIDAKEVRRRERWGSLVPNWKFFTPNPIAHDFHLHVRTVGADGAEGPWRDAAPIPARAWRQVVWFPLRRRDRALGNIMPAVSQAAWRGDIMAAAAELRVLDGMAAHVARRADPDAVAYRFSLLRRQGEDGPATRPYVSSVRPLR